MPNRVPGHGCSSAKLVAVGEAPGENEDILGIPFTGAAGDLLNQALDFAGISRSEIYITNVCKVRPPDNDLKRLHEIGVTLEDFKQELWDEIDMIKPNCILALGDTALNALTGLKGIKHYRGSILSALDTRKVVQTLHPASLLHGGRDNANDRANWKEFAWIKFDIKRAVEQSAFPDIILPNRNLHIARHSIDVYRFLNRFADKKFAVIDVETTHTYAQCIGIAFTGDEAISIPVFSESIPIPDMACIWKMLYEFFNDTNIRLGAQNAKFDEKRCRQLGLTWAQPCLHSLDMMWHILCPEFPKRLEFISSILTTEPYYKDEGKDFNPKIHSLDRWYLYNAKDAAVEYECIQKCLIELEERNLLDFYCNNPNGTIRDLYSLYYEIEDTGILIDQNVNKQLREKYNAMFREKQDELVKLIADGHEETYELFKTFNVNSNGAKNQVAKLLFGHLKLPIRADTSDETLKSLANNVAKQERIKKILFLILEIRKIRKTISTYLEAKISEGEPWLI